MVILVALAGILVPMLPGMLGKAHSSAHTTNVGELNKVWELFYANNRGYPDGLDSLIAGTDVFSKIPEATGGPYTAQTVTELATLVGVDADNVIERLNEVGITTVYHMDATTDNATFEPYVLTGGLPTPTPIVAATELCQVASAEVNEKLNGHLDGVFVAFGVGSRNTAVGRGGMAEAPVHFSDAAGPEGDPTQVYCRYGVIFNIKQDPPVFVGAVAFHHGGIGGADAGLSGYYAGHHHD